MVMQGVADAVHELVNPQILARQHVWPLHADLRRVHDQSGGEISTVELLMVFQAHMTEHAQVIAVKMLDEGNSITRLSST